MSSRLTHSLVMVRHKRVHERRKRRHLVSPAFKVVTSGAHFFCAGLVKGQVRAKKTIGRWSFASGKSRCLRVVSTHPTRVIKYSSHHVQMIFCLQKCCVRVKHVLFHFRRRLLCVVHDFPHAGLAVGVQPAGPECEFQHRVFGYLAQARNHRSPWGGALFALGGAFLCKFLRRGGRAQYLIS